MEYITILYQSLFSAVALFLLTKIMGYRQVAQFSMFDYVNGITIGSIAAEMAINIEGEYMKPFVAMLVYAAFAIMLSKLSEKSIYLRRLINGKAITLFKHGKIYNENLRKAKMDVDELLVECRILGYFDLSKIDSIILEPNGKLSILPVSTQRPASPKDLGMDVDQDEVFANVVVDGHILKENLKHIGKDKNWLMQQLEGQNVKLTDTFLAICDKQGNFHVYPKVHEVIDKDILG